jgi:hypothetical protein
MQPRSRRCASRFRQKPSRNSQSPRRCLQQRTVAVPVAKINVVSKSGTNKLHGSIFEYIRNSAFDARPVLNRKPGPQSPFHLNQFGGTLGGPIRKDKTFFFASYEGFRQSLGGVPVGFVPTAAFKAMVPQALQVFMNAYRFRPLPTLKAQCTTAFLWTVCGPAVSPARNRGCRFHSYRSPLQRQQHGLCAV